MKIAYLTSLYPAVSHTFILREVAALRAYGSDIGTFSIRRPTPQDVLGPDAEKEAATTRWLVPPTVADLIVSLFWSVGTRPIRTWSALATAAFGRGLTIGQRCKWTCYFIEAVMLARALVGENFDHLHCHFGNNGASTGMLAAQLADLPFSMTCHGSELHEIQRHRLIEKIRQASFVACVSEYGKAKLTSVCSPEHQNKLHVVRCGVDGQIKAATAPPDGPPSILCVARMSPEKGHIVLLDALVLLRNEGIAFHCTLVGDGPLKGELESRIHALHLDNAVTLTGSLDPQRVSLAYDDAHVVVLSSFSEGVPVVLMEAMSHRRPVVATRVGGVTELVKDRLNGLLVDPGNAEALAHALKSLLEDPEWAMKLGAHGSQILSREFSIEASTRRLSGLFEQSGRSKRETSAIEPREPKACEVSRAPQDP